MCYNNSDECYGESVECKFEIGVVGKKVVIELC